MGGVWLLVMVMHGAADDGEGRAVSGEDWGCVW